MIVMYYMWETLCGLFVASRIYGYFSQDSKLFKVFEIAKVYESGAFKVLDIFNINIKLICKILGVGLVWGVGSIPSTLR